MAAKRRLYIYIMTNKWHTVLYTGVTNNLPRRVWQHRNPGKSSFTSQYNIDRLVWYDFCDDARVAIAREKQIKAGSRAQKVGLIEEINPTWRDLSEDF